MNINPYQAQLEKIDQDIQTNQQLLSDPELALLAQEEISRLENEKKAIESAASDYQQAMEEKDSPTVSLNTAKAIIEIRAGAGGDEAKIWASDLLRMYIRFIENNGLKYEYLDEMVIKIRGQLVLEEIDQPLYPFELFKNESGVHRVQRVPVTEAQGRIHTSTASVAVLPEVNANAVHIRDEDLEWQFVRAGGAGGQSVNKTSSAVRLTHKPSGLVVRASRERKQAQNRQIALELLRSQLWEIEEEKKLSQLGEARSAIGRNMRAEKIRTYNYPQNRVTDHRINESWHNLESILEGNLTQVILEVRQGLNPETKEN